MTQSTQAKLDGKRFAVIVDGVEVGQYTRKDKANARAKKEGDEARVIDRVELEQQVAEAIDLEERMDEELAAQGIEVVEITKEEAEETAADRELKRLKAEIKRETDENQEKRRATGNRDKRTKTKTRTLATPKSGKSKTGEAQPTPTPGLDLGLSEANKYTKRMSGGVVLVETNPLFRQGWSDRAEASAKSILARRNWTIEIRNAGELAVLIDSATAVLALAEAEEKPKPRPATLKRMIGKLEELSQLFV